MNATTIVPLSQGDGWRGQLTLPGVATHPAALDTLITRPAEPDGSAMPIRASGDVPPEPEGLIGCVVKTRDGRRRLLVSGHDGRRRTLVLGDDGTFSEEQRRAEPVWRRFGRATHTEPKPPAPRESFVAFAAVRCRRVRRAPRRARRAALRAGSRAEDGGEGSSTEPRPGGLPRGLNRRTSTSAASSGTVSADGGGP
jgi:hypothetical protein